MVERKRAIKGQFKKATKIRKELPVEDSQKLKQYLSTIDDLNSKLFNDKKYPDIDPDSYPLIDESGNEWGLWESIDWDPSLRANFWQWTTQENWISVDNKVLEKNEKLQRLEEFEISIIIHYELWQNWIQHSEFSNQYLPLVESLHPATRALLANIVPSYQSPEEISVLETLERFYDPAKHSQHGNSTFKEFQEYERGRYQEFARSVRKHYSDKANELFEMAELIRKYAPITKEKKWPAKWMLNHKGIMGNLEKKKLFIPILQYITDHALFRGDSIPKKDIGSYHHEDGKEYQYVLTKINKNKIAEELEVSPDTIKRYVGAMKRNGFIKPVVNPYYAIGYWNQTHKSKVYFLKNTPDNKRKLINFSIK